MKNYPYKLIYYFYHLVYIKILLWKILCIIEIIYNYYGYSDINRVITNDRLLKNELDLASTLYFKNEADVFLLKITCGI